MTRHGAGDEGSSLPVDGAAIATGRSPTTATGSITLTAGAVIRGRLRREITRAAWEAGLTVKIDEQKGLLESVMRVRLTGPADLVHASLLTLQKYLADTCAASPRR